MERIFGKVDKTILWGGAIISLVFVLLASIFTDSVMSAFNFLFGFFTEYFGWAYLAGVSLFVIFCLSLAFSRYGNIKLAKSDDEKPEFSTMSWFAMLFAAGMGVGLVFWGAAEPINHFAAPPTTEPLSAAAATEAMRYTFFHWGIHAWAIYGVVALGLAYSQFRKGLPGLISSAFYPILGEEGIKGPIGKTIDTFTVVLTLFGLATSLALGAMQVNTGLNIVAGVPNTVFTSMGFVAIITVAFTFSAATGINRGIRFLSNTNMVIAFTIIALVIILGPTLYIFNVLSESFGSYIQNIIGMSFFTDSQGIVKEHVGWDFVGAWTVFYWAWWITWAPFVGSFIARISKGRTIKEFVIGILIAPTLLSCLWFSILGGTAIHAENNYGGVVDATFADVTNAIFVTFSHLPVSGLLSVLAMILVTIFLITSADSSTFVVSAMTSRGVLEPKVNLRILWGIASGAIAAMLILTGGFDAVQSVALVAAFPFLIIMCLMMYSLLKSLSSEVNVTQQSTSKAGQGSNTHNV